MSAERILILGGTREAAKLAKRLVEDGHDVTTSLAGRTKEPAPLAGAVRTGGFGGVDGLATWLEAHGITRVIDATHPFAEQISANAQMATQQVGLPIETRTRPPWKRQLGDDWIEVASLKEAAMRIEAGARVLLALGSQHLSAFALRSDVHFTIRMIDPPAAPSPHARHEIVLARPAPDPEAEAAFLQEQKINVIVCRNSGGPGAYAKIEAARALHIPVIILSRPAR